MNPRFLLLHTVAGLFAGYTSWLTFHDFPPWSFGEGFQTTLFTTGIFGAVLLGMAAGLATLFNQWQARKACHQFLLNAVPALAFAMPAAVLFSLITGSTGLPGVAPSLVVRGLWWSILSVALGACRGFVTGNIRAAAHAMAGLLPGLLSAGLLLDFFFTPRGLWLPGSLFFGAVVGACMALSLDLLKEAWLEDIGYAGIWRPQYLLDTDELVAGSDQNCDLVLPDAPAFAFTIIEKDEGHVLEALDDNPIKVTGGRFRCRLLVDGDTFEVAGHVFVYHNRLARTRDTVPQPASLS